MTDGQQSYVPNIKDPQDIARDLINDGIDIMAVGIGEEIARIELEAYISKPANLFLASNFDALVNQLVTEVTQALTCDGEYYFFSHYFFFVCCVLKSNKDLVRFNKPWYVFTFFYFHFV